MTLLLTTQNFLPGPVRLHAVVREAFSREPISHRGEEFLAEFEDVRSRLRRLVRANHVQVLLGSGTLANDVVGAQLSLLGGAPGIVARNGEFGERLVDHARRWGLNFREVVAPWGEALPFDELRRVARDIGAAWIWAARCETSTGVLNDLAALRSIAEERGARLCLDGISAIGTMDEDWSGVWLATGTSGKGLGAPPGLSMVFHDEPAAPSARLPRYLDLGCWAGADGVPFTTSSNLVAALRASLRLFAHGWGGRSACTRGGRFAETAALAAWLRPRLEGLRLRVMAPESISSPAVFTLSPPEGVRSLDLSDRLAARRVLVSCRSGYLVERNLFQVCLMGVKEREEAERLLSALGESLGDLRPAPTAKGSNGSNSSRNGASALAGGSTPLP